MTEDFPALFSLRTQIVDINISADALELSGSVLAVSFNDPHPIQYL